MIYARATNNKVYNKADLTKVEDERYPNRYIARGKLPITVIKESENLKSLVDEVVIVEEGLPPHIFNKQDFEAYISCSNDREGYGAIWTTRGLIYVARADEEGKLELLR